MGPAHTEPKRKLTINPTQMVNFYDATGNLYYIAAILHIYIYVSTFSPREWPDLILGVSLFDHYAIPAALMATATTKSRNRTHALAVIRGMKYALAN